MNNHYKFPGNMNRKYIIDIMVIKISANQYGILKILLDSIYAVTNEIWCPYPHPLAIYTLHSLAYMNLNSLFTNAFSGMGTIRNWELNLGHTP